MVFKGVCFLLLKGKVAAALEGLSEINRVAGHVAVSAGQVNFRGSLPCLTSYVLEPMLHPGIINLSCLVSHIS